MSYVSSAEWPHRSPVTQHIEWASKESASLESLSPDASEFARCLPPYDVIVIGGGINGTGIARDAALRGLRVLLLEKEDFGAGTSAYSSRLIHGGLRYLENMEFDLVHESLTERERLLKNAPHLVRPLPLAIPVYESSKKPGWMIRMGMLLYDTLSFRKQMPSHEMLSRRSFILRYPGVNPEALTGGAVYYDAQVEFPERVCVENAIAAMETGNASVLNHASVTGFSVINGAVQGVFFQDTLNGERFFATTSVVVNAAGPWVDAVLQLGLATSGDMENLSKLSPRIGGTKGSHIVVRRFAGGPDTALYVEAESDGRPFFIIPWRESYYLIGTTDRYYEGNPADAAADAEEVGYLLRETNRVLPNANLTENNVLYSYAGIRPLPYVPPESGTDEGKVTRRHQIADHASDLTLPVLGLVSVIGGKLTTYRNLAEETVDYVVKHYRLRLPSGSPVPGSRTASQPLPGGVNIDSLPDYKLKYMLPTSCEYRLSEAQVGHLIDLYGSRYRDVCNLVHKDQNWKKPVSQQSGDLLAQVVYAVRYEMAFTVQDVMLRRLSCGFEADAGLESVEAVAQCMSDVLDWDDTRLQQEIVAYRDFVQRRFLAFRQPTEQPVRV